MSTPRLIELYKKYHILEHKYGTVGDKLGDVFEEFCVNIFENTDYLLAFNKGKKLTDLEFYIFDNLLKKAGFSANSNIIKITATNRIPNRVGAGSPKTDILLSVAFHDSTYAKIPISIKQSTVAKVAFAEFDVDTIVREIGIEDTKLISLMYKHQVDASAKNFTETETQSLVERLLPYKFKFVKWVVTGSPINSEDIRIPKYVIKFDLSKNYYEVTNCTIYTSDEYVMHIMYNYNGEPKRGGFGTGLSWTYATGSKGQKIQFKG